jgi:putative nucleotidyltransferase with HDIG domain
MEARNKRKKFINRLAIPSFFVIAIIVIVCFIPRESKFKYLYLEDRPWQYGLLTAPFDFHIQKSDKVIEAEKDSIMKSFQPYYMEKDGVEKEVISQFERDANARGITGEYVSYLNKKLAALYKAGIISGENYDNIEKSGKKNLKLSTLESRNRVVTRNLSSFYTPRTAYEQIVKDRPEYIDMSVLQSLNLNNYLEPNIVYDEDRSSSLKDELLSQIILYEGLVQSGEKIIDRGEIIDSRTFDILNSYTKELEKKSGAKANPLWLIIGQVIMVSSLIMFLMLFLLYFRTREYKNQKSVIFILLLVTFFAVFTAVVSNYKAYSVIYMIPFTISTILVRTFIDSRTAMVTHMITVLICSLMVPQPAEFIAIQLMVGIVCILSLRNFSERSQLLFTSIIILITYIVAYTGWVLSTEADVVSINWRMYVYFCINFIFVTFAYILVYVCEKVFGFISEVSMIELSNINKPLLQKLSEVAPGTFQHSMQVSNLVSAAAVRIGANAPLARTGALYHDIGKMENPAFFTENQSPGMNPHAGLSYKESARIIISHVEEGVRIAKKYNLPQQIIDFIETHHGRGKAKYFYNSYKNEHPDEEVDEADFTYPGPNPFSKETALLMMADTVEAASRSLPEYTPESISALVNRLIDDQVQDGLMNNAPITFQEIQIAKKVYIDKLIRIYHSRIAYPELKEKEVETEE